LFALADVGQSVSAFRIANDGSLTPVGKLTGLPATVAGLVAR
jgi:hypothetical protein